MEELQKGDYVRTKRAIFGGGSYNGLFDNTYIPARSLGYLVGQRQTEPVSVWVVAFDEPKHVLVLAADLRLAEGE